MKNFKNTEFVIVDVETTGLSPRFGDRIIEIAALKVKNLQPAERFVTFVDPQREISYGAFLVNRITPHMLKGAPKADTVMPEFLKFIGRTCLVGHNINFDLSFITYELGLLGLELGPRRTILDTLRLSRNLLPDLGSYALRSVSYALGVEQVQQHRAMADVEITCEVFRKLLEIADRRDICELEQLISL